MSRPILSRPRTRVYGCNYDKGESYYKPMVDHLDRKYSGRPLFSEPRTSLADEIAARRNDIGTRDLSGPRAGSSGRERDLDLDLDLDPRHLRASQAGPLDPLLLHLPDDEDTVFDSRGQRTRRRLAADEFANEVASTTRRFKARIAAQLTGLGEDSVKSAIGADLNGADATTTTTAFDRRSKMFSEEADRLDERSGLTRWSKLLGSSGSGGGGGGGGGAGGDHHDEDRTMAASAAMSRARQTKARLNDLESEMEELAERQAKRERRAAALRALVNETALAGDEQQQQQQQHQHHLHHQHRASVLTKNVSSVRSVQATERAKKHVTF